jgi:hypothetical protein
MAFQWCTSLERIKLPDTVTDLYDQVFCGTSLKEINFPGNLVAIGGYSFNSTLLPSIVFPSSLRYIGSWTFLNNTKLTSVTFDKGSQMTELGDFVFYQCPSLSSVKLPEKLEYLGAAAFLGCISVKEIELPKTLIMICENAFFGTSLTQINLPESLCFLEDACFSRTNITSIAIPSAVKFIGPFCFSECVYLENVLFGNESQLVEFSKGIFANCTALSKIELPNALNIIGNNTFQGCSALSSLRIPCGIKTCSSSAFAGCINLSRVYIPGKTICCAICDGLSSTEFPQRENVSIFVDWNCENKTVCGHKVVILPTPTSSPSDHPAMSTGAIIGVVVGPIAALGLIVLVAFLIMRKKKEEERSLVTSGIIEEKYI